MLKRALALLLAAATAASMTTVAFAKTRYVIEEGFIDLDTDELDSDTLQPGVTYRIPILDGRYEFDEESAEIWRITVDEVREDENGKRRKSKLSELDIEKGRDGCYYLIIEPKTPTRSQREDDDYEDYVEIVITTQEKGISKSDAKIESTRDPYYDVEDEDGEDTELGDYVYIKNQNTFGFDIDDDGDDEDYVNDDEYEVDNDNPRVEISDDLDRTTFIFGNVAEYDARFGSGDRYFNLSSTTSRNSGVVRNNPNAELEFISFNKRPLFSGNFYLRFLDDDMEYVYEIDDGELVKLRTYNQDGDLAIRTDRLTSYVASDIPLRGAASDDYDDDEDDDRYDDRYDDEDDDDRYEDKDTLSGKVDTQQAVNKVKSLITGTNKTAYVMVENDAEVTPYTLQQMANAASAKGGKAVLMGDTVVGKRTEGRVSVNAAQGAKLQKNIQLGVRTSSAACNRVEKIFDNYFSNELEVVSLAQKGSYGMKVTVAAAIDLDDMNKNNLVFYTYDSAKNSYKQLTGTNYRVDKNGYVHFDTGVGGEIIISSGALR